MRRLDEIARETPGVKHTVSVSGQSVLLGTNAPNFATLYVMLDEFPNRLAPDRTADAIAAKLRDELSADGAGIGRHRLRGAAGGWARHAGGFKLVVEDPMRNRLARTRSGWPRP